MDFKGIFACAAEVSISVMLLAEAHAQVPAQSPSAAKQGGDQLQQMTVTGYLIPRAGEGPQPVLNYDRDYIEKTGYQTVSDVLQNLPSAIGNFAPNVTTGISFSPGSASVALKGLPPNDTLTLVDGLRYPQFPFPQVSTTAVISFVDLNSIPLASVDRIEVLNDGGSATYGTDAIAGVVNVILKDEYNGADLLNYFGISQRGDAEVYHGSLIGGLTQKFSDTSKVSIVAAIDYYTSGPIMQEDRAFTNLHHSLLSPKYPDQPNLPSYAGQFSDAAGNFYQVIPGTKGPAVTASNFTVNGPVINEFNDQFYQLQPRESRLGGSVKIKYEPTDWLKFYDSLIIQRNEELSSYQNEGVYPPSDKN